MHWQAGLRKTVRKWAALPVGLAVLILASSCDDERVPPPGTLSGCNGCHATVGSGSHPTHVVTEGYDCAKCHDGYVTNPTHADGTIDSGVGLVSFDGDNPGAVYDGVTCASTWCHGPSSRAPDPVWGGPQVNCGECHTTPMSDAGPTSTGGTHTTSTDCSACHGMVVNPDDTTFADESRHLDGIVDVSAVTCDSCHPVPATGNHPTHSIAEGYECTKCHDGYLTNPNHIDGTIDSGIGLVSFDIDNPSASYDGTNCSSTWCHGPSSLNAATSPPAWGGSAMNCGDCHTTPMDGTLTTGGVIHTTSTDCSACHGMVVNPDDTTFLDESRHLDGIVDVSATSCNACHTTPASPSHPTHVDVEGYACEKCHDGYLADANHINGSADTGIGLVSFDIDNPSASYDGTNCSSTWCHGPSSRFADPAWGGSAVGCGECHTMPMSDAGPTSTGGTHTTDADCNACHADVINPDNTTFADPARHLDGIVDISAATCTACHSPLPSSGSHTEHVVIQGYECTKCHDGYISSPTHNDTNPDSGAGLIGFDADNPLGSYDGTSCSSTWCHGPSSRDFDPVWGVSTVNCGNCHTSPMDGTAGSTGVRHTVSDDCSLCHDTVVAPDDVTIIAPGLHGDFNVQADITGAACTDCHTSMTSGHHTTHVATAGYACTVCHDGYGTNPNHRNGTDDATGTIAFDGSNPSGSYAEAGSTCSSTWCHGPSSLNVATSPPAWTDGAFAGCANCHTSPMDGTATTGGPIHTTDPTCNTCHAGATHLNFTAEYNITTAPCGNCHTSVTSGSHTTHVSAPQNYGCEKCHDGYSSDPNHYNGTDEVGAGLIAFDADNPLGNYDGANCSNTWCHGPSSLNAPTSPPAWGGSALICGQCHTIPMSDAGPTSTGGTHTTDPTCNTCHSGATHLNFTAEYDITTAPCGNCHTTPLTDSHQTHVDVEGYACTTCHDGYSSDPNHYNGTDEVGAGLIAFDAFNPFPASYNDGTGRCSDTWCHGPSSRDFDPVWGLSTVACGNCHTSPMSNAGPTSTGGTHTFSDKCGECHAAVASDSSTITTPALHIDGNVQYDVSGAACNTCHGDATGDSPPFDTSGNAATTFTTVGAHRSHLGTLITTSVSCTTCHTVPATVMAAGHIDATPGAETDFTGLGSSTVWNGTTCSSTYCHGTTTPTWTNVSGSALPCDSCHGWPPPAPHTSDGQCQTCHASVVSAPATISDPTLHIDGSVQYDVSTAACNTCHGGANDAPPADLWGSFDTADTGVGAHQAHLSPGRSAVVACTECHVAVSTGNEAVHIDGDNAAEVTFGALADSDGVTSTWDGTTCSTYCHGASLNGGVGTAPNWTTVDGTQDECGDCHGLPPGGAHPNSNQCGNCHSLVADNSQQIIPAGAALHVNGNVEIDTFTCTSCHGTDGVSDAPPDDRYGNSATTFRGVGAHQRHLGSTITTPVACGECHAVPPADDLTHIDDVQPADVDMSAGPRAILLSSSPSYEATGLTCANTYCHGGKLATPTIVTPAWNALTLPDTPCDRCHGWPPPAPHENNTDCSQCHGEVVNADDLSIKEPLLHIDGTVQGGESGGSRDCGTCHTGIWERLNGATVTNFGGQPIVSLHSIGAVDGTNDSYDHTSPDATWGDPLGNVAVADRSCTNMCHNDHPHGAGLHTDSVYEDATDSTSRAGAATSTDFNGAATNGGMCVSCHRNPINASGSTIDKAAYDASAHDYTDFSTYGAWTYTQHDGAVFNRNCTKCHADSGDAQQDSTPPFGAAHFSDYPSLLSGSTNPDGTPATFICYNCHGNGSTGTDRSGKDIATDMAKANAHPVNASAAHDAAAELTVAHGDDVYAGAKRHANCLDCHNPHAAQPGVHNYSTTATSTRNNITGPLMNVSGVSVDYTGLANFEAPADTDYTWIPASTGATKEYQICFKCHTTFATTGGSGPPPVPVGMLYLTNNPITIANEPTDHTMSVTFTTPQGGSDPWVLRSMEAANGGADFRQDVYISTSTGVRYYRGRTWMSPELADQDIPAQNWTILIPARERDAGANAFLYLKIWVWEPGGGQRGLLFDEAVVNGEFQTSFAYPDVTATVGGAAVNGVLEGDRLIVEAAYYTDSTGGLSDWRVHLRYGDAGYDAYIDPANDILLKGAASGGFDRAQEFSPMNRSGHPVVTGLDNYPNSTLRDGNKGLAAGSMKPPWDTNVGQQTMMCSDCHNTDAASPAAQGPHGSAVPVMLREVFNGTPGPTAWPNVTAANFNQSWCSNCHNNTAGSPHTRSGDHTPLPCYACHIVIPHGGRLSRLMADNDTMPARYAYGGALSTNYMQEFRKRTTGGYQDTDCRAQCAGNHDSRTPGENW